MGADPGPWMHLIGAGYYLAPIRVRRGPDGRKRTAYLKERTDGPGWGELATLDPDKIRYWCERFGDGLGFLIACQPSGIVVPDLDLKPAEGIDALRWWAGEGLPVSPMVVDTPSGGQHHYWRQSDPPIPNSTGAIARGVDVRGVGQRYGGLVHAPGTRVVGGEGSEVYRLLDALIPAAELPILPPEIVERIPEARRRRRVTAGDSAQGRSHQLSWIESEVKRLRDAAAELPAKSGVGFRYALMGAAMMSGRFVVAADRPREAAEKYLRGAVEKVWGTVNDEDEEWIQTGLDDGEADPYTIEPEEEEAHDPDVDPDGYAARLSRLVAGEVERMQVRELAQREWQRARDADKPRIADGLIDVRDLHKIEAPRMLMGGLIPADSVGFLAGKSGSYKSFLAVSWACHLASGRAWQASPEFEVPERQRVLYVAAEGAAGIAQRIQAWEAGHGVELPAGSLVVYPRPIKLNSELVAEELHQLVGERGFDVVIVDTYHRSAAGSDENDATEFSTVFEAVARLRDDHGCSTLFLDHTGHGGGRPRGTSAKIDDSDYILVSDYEGMVRARHVQRTLSVFKLKDQDVAGEWSIRLADVPEIGPRGSAYIEIGDVAGGRSLLPLTPRWFDLDAVPVPAEIVNLNGKGREAARDIFRILAYIEEPDGLTTAQIRRALNEHTGVDYSDSVYFAGLSMLKKEGVIGPGASASKHVLSPRLAPS
jgi:hypothetical protein